MKIALLNPWRNAAENQLVPGITRVAQALGHQTVECASAREIEAARPDFVLSLSRTQPKLTNVPTYGLVFDPRHILLERPSYLHNILSYDGVLTIFETLQQFLADVMFSVRREAIVGEFYPTAPQVTWDGAIAFDDARLAYFGINWDRRRHGLFALLDDEPWMEIYGPEHGWAGVVRASYRGETPFDGSSVLQRYRQAGAGLCLFSDGHFSDNIVTSRVFEICAAGAVVIAPHMPWLVQNFGDAILYFDQGRTDREIHDQLRQHVTWIRSHPAEAAALAARSQQVFSERFSLDVLLPNVFAFHERLVGSRAAPSSGETVSVVVPWADRTTGMLQRSLESLGRQDYPSLDVIVAVGSEDDAIQAHQVLAELSPPVTSRTVIADHGGHGPNASRPAGSALLWAGLRACQGAYVAVLPGGDEWMAGHVTSLALALDGETPSDLAFSSSIVHHDAEFVTRGGSTEVRRLAPVPFAQSRQDIVQDALEIPLATVMFRRHLLDRWILVDPQLRMCHDAYLIVSLLAKATPVFTYRATAVCYESGEAWRRKADPAYTEDVTRLRLRFVGRTFPPAPRTTDFAALQRIVERGETRRQQEVGEVRRVDGVTQYRVPAPFEYAVGPEDTWTPAPLAAVPTDIELLGASQIRREEPGCPDGPPTPLVIEPPDEPWAHGLRWRLALPEDRPYVIRLRCKVESGTAGFGVLDGRMRHYTYRVFVPSQDGSVVVDLPVADPATATMLVVQSTLASRSVRVILDDLQVLTATAHYPMDTVKDLLREFEQFRATQVTVQRQLRDANDTLKDALDATQRDHESVSEQLTAAQSRLIQAESLLARRDATPEGAPPQSERLCGSDDANDDERTR